ncbi:hypothetical protein DFH06DRAFT_1351326 [Mycena polygramma]|nr:hypothetical protein DFH06DRAFT_1351326 [Mycena polygramma]
MHLLPGPDTASDNRNNLAKTLYSLFFAWLNEHIDQHLCKDGFPTFISLFDLLGSRNVNLSMKELFSGRAITTEAHPLKEDKMLAAVHLRTLALLLLKDDRHLVH